MSEQNESKNEQSSTKQAANNGEEGGTTLDVRSEAEAAVQKLETMEGEDEGITDPVTIVDMGNTTNDLQQEAIKAMALKAEKDRLEQANLEPAIFTDDMILRLDVVETNEPIILAVNGDLTVGRADNVTDYIPEIDLTSHGAYRLGLSRRHALVRLQQETLFVKDLSSRNGTFVNGEQVKAGDTHPLKDGDELRFGNLALRVNFQRKS